MVCRVLVGWLPNTLRLVVFFYPVSLFPFRLRGLPISTGRCTLHDWFAFLHTVLLLITDFVSLVRADFHATLFCTSWRFICALRTPLGSHVWHITDLVTFLLCGSRSCAFRFLPFRNFVHAFLLPHFHTVSLRFTSPGLRVALLRTGFVCSLPHHAHMVAHAHLSCRSVTFVPPLPGWMVCARSLTRLHVLVAFTRYRSRGWLHILRWHGLPPPLSPRAYVTWFSLRCSFTAHLFFLHLPAGCGFGSLPRYRSAHHAYHTTPPATSHRFFAHIAVTTGSHTFAPTVVHLHSHTVTRSDTHASVVLWVLPRYDMPFGLFLTHTVPHYACCTTRLGCGLLRCHGSLLLRSLPGYTVHG